CRGVVKPLPNPTRPLSGGASWVWDRTTTKRWSWCRVYKHGAHSPTGITHRTYGPLYRFDPHTPPVGHPALCPDGRSVLYVADDLATSLAEVFGDVGDASICRHYRVAIIEPKAPLTLLDLHRKGTAMQIGALPMLNVGDIPRDKTQAWARAIYEDQPLAPRTVRGIRYTAAHTAGAALALWNTDHHVRVTIKND